MSRATSRRQLRSTAVATALALVVTAAAAVAFATWSREPGVASSKARARKTTVKVTEKLRADYIARGSVRLPRPTPSALEILAGPDPESGFTSDEIVHCRYFNRTNNGSNAKFRCYRTNADNQLVDTKGRVHADVRGINRHKRFVARDGTELGKADELKVKYFESRGTDHELSKDMHTEVAATRLLWALGFPADRMHSVGKVVCFGCPENPTTGKGSRATRRFANAAIERKFRGRTIRLEARQRGWSWDEAGAAPWSAKTRADYHSLQIVLTVINHISNQTFQNRLSCGPGQLGDEGLCQQPILLVHDLGATFGSRERASTDQPRTKGDLAWWRRQAIWKHPETCLLSLEFCGDEIPCASDVRYRVSEAGRALAVELFERLTTAHLSAIFESARFDLVDLDLRDQVARRLAGSPANPAAREAAVRAETIRHWVDALQSKLDQVANVSCPSG